MPLLQEMCGLQVETDWAALVKEKERIARLTEHHSLPEDAPNYLPYPHSSPFTHHTNISLAPSVCRPLCLVETRLDKPKPLSALGEFISRTDNKQRRKQKIKNKLQIRAGTMEETNELR